MKTKHDLNDKCFNLSLRAREKLKTKRTFSVNFISGIERLKTQDSKGLSQTQRLTTKERVRPLHKPQDMPADTASNDPESLHKQGADRDITREMNFASC